MNASDRLCSVLQSLALRIAAVCIFLLAPVASAVPTNVVQTGSGAAIARVKTGLDRNTVIRLLGWPMGNIRKGNTEILYFGEMGTVTLRDGVVVSSDVVSEEDARLAAEQRVREAAAREAAQIADRERRIAEGAAEKQRIATDPAFASMPPGKRLEYWRKFAKAYPEVSVDGDIAAAETEAGTAEKARMSADPAFRSLPPAEQVRQWQSLAAQHPRISVADEIQQAQAEANGADSKAIAEKISAMEAAAQDAETRSHWTGKYTHRTAQREYIGLTNEIAKLKELQAPTEGASSTAPVPDNIQETTPSPDNTQEKTE